MTTQPDWEGVDRSLGRAQGCLTASLWLIAIPFILAAIALVVFLIWLF